MKGFLLKLSALGWDLGAVENHPTTILVAPMIPYTYCPLAFYILIF